MQTLWASLVAQDCKESACNVGDVSLIPGPGRSPGGGHGNPLQYSCLESPMDGEAWQATVHGGHKESDTLCIQCPRHWVLNQTDKVPELLEGTF